MKNLKLLGIIAMVAVMGFSTVACGNDDDDNNSNGGNNGGGENWSAWQTVTSGQSDQLGGWNMGYTGEFTRDSILVEVKNGTPARFSVYKGQTQYVSTSSNQITFRYSPSSITYIVSGTVRFRD